MELFVMEWWKWGGLFWTNNGGDGLQWLLATWGRRFVEEQTIARLEDGSKGTISYEYRTYIFFCVDTMYDSADGYVNA